MKRRMTVAVALLMTVLLAAWTGTVSAEANKKLGKVYFKMICTVCHMTQAGRAIPPNSRTMKEWQAYLDADQHDMKGKSNHSVKYYMSKEYRQSIKDSNKAALKFLDMPDEQIQGDVRAFAVSGAKDSDTPASCE